MQGLYEPVQQKAYWVEVPEVSEDWKIPEDFSKYVS
jgi:hypothetical protein